MILSDQYNKIFHVFLSGTACCSMLFGNLMAIKQNNIKRVLAYSSVAHVGYVLIGVIALRTNLISLETIGIYLTSYLLSNAGAFGVISIMSVSCIGEDTNSLFAYRGLFWHKPMLPVVFTIVILSLAGISMILSCDRTESIIA